jgi:hypothetical protein
MTQVTDTKFFLTCIDKVLSHLFIQRRFDVVRLFTGRDAKTILLYLIMRFYYREKLGSIQISDIPTKEFLFKKIGNRSSRLSISKFIDSMAETGVLIKELATFDKRKSILRPSALLVKEFEAMHEQRDVKLKGFSKNNEATSLEALLSI